MLEIIIVAILGILLLGYMVKKSTKNNNLITKILIILEILAICYLPFQYYSNAQVGIFAKILVYIFAIILPLIIIIYEVVTGKNYSESLVIIIANYFLKKGNSKKAKEILIRNIRKNPKSYIMHKKLGQIYEKEGGIRRAIYEYLTVIEINKVEYETMLKIISLLEVLDQKEEAIELLDRLITLQKGYPEAYIRYAELLEEKELKKDAVKVYLEGIKYNPDNFILHYNLATLYVKLDEYSMAKSCLQEAIRINPRSYITMLNLGQILLIEQDYEEAKSYLDEALKDEKIRDIVYYEYAKIDMLEEQKEEALTMLNMALDINPDIIEKINNNEIFKDIRQDTIVKVQLVKNERPKLNIKSVEMINKLEETLEIAVALGQNEKKVIRETKINNIIKSKSENRSIEELIKNFQQTQEFLAKHVKNADKEFSKHFYGDKGKHSIYNDEQKATNSEKELKEDDKT